jgi:NADP-dependent 3-hydroxy acid dehydrogenase YdfG
VAAGTVPAVVAVTGGARGIGLATARAFAASGARVAIGDIDADLAAAEAAAIGGFAAPLDVRDRGSFADFLARAAEDLGPVDVLVNNAGVAPRGTFVGLDPAVHDLVVDINLRGVLNGMRLALPGMVERGRGHIVNVASLAGRVPIGTGAVYAATKHAVVGVSEVVRAELHATGVRVTVVLPGFVRTELTTGLPPGRPVLTASAVADAIVRATRRRRAPGVVTVPRWMTVVGAAYPLIPPRLRARWGAGSGPPRETGDRTGYEHRVGGLTDEA